MPPTIDAWTAYWRTGRGASCFEGAERELRLAGIWENLVDSLKDDSALIDLATGNGAVACICAARARQRNMRLRIEAVDAADIDPPKFMQDPRQLLAQIRFQAGVQLEALPFSDATFDAVVSQFGFEYAIEDRALAEALRVLAPGGVLKLVLHARDGAVSRDIGARVKRLRAVLEERGAVTLVRTLVRALHARDEAAIREATQHLPAAIETVKGFVATAPRDDAAIFYASEFLRSWSLRHRTDIDRLRRSIEDGWQSAVGVVSRQAEMLRVARSQEDVAALAAKLETAGLDVAEAKPIRDNRRDAHFAWLIDARRPSA